MWEDPRNLGKGKGHCFVVCEKLISYTLGRCTVWLTGRRLQSIVGLVLCIRRRCAVMNPAASSIPKYGHGICLRSLARYESPTPVHLSATAFSDIPARNAMGCHVIVRDFATLSARPYFPKSPTRTFIACCSQSKSRDPTVPSSV